MAEPNDVTKSLLEFSAFDTSYVFEPMAGPTMASADATSVLTTPRETIPAPTGQGAMLALDTRKELGLRDLPTFEKLEETVAAMPDAPRGTSPILKFALAVLLLRAIA